MTEIKESDFVKLNVDENIHMDYPHNNRKKKILSIICKDNWTVFVLIFIIVVILVAVVAPTMSIYEFDTINMKQANMLPNHEHWFGTDTLGRDLWTRVWIGTRLSIIIGVCGAVIPQCIGFIIGSISGFCGGWIDTITMAIVDVGTCIPSLVYITLLSLWLGSDPVSIIFAISISSWMDSARMVRGRTIQFKAKDMIIAAKLQGNSMIRLILKHIFPNIAGYMIISLISAIPSAIFLEAYLSFIGLGISSPLTSLGQLCKSGTNIYRLYPYQLFIPGAIISSIILAFYILGNRLRDMIDPKLQ